MSVGGRGRPGRSGEGVGGGRPDCDEGGVRGRVGRRRVGGAALGDAARSVAHVEGHCGRNGRADGQSKAAGRSGKEGDRRARKDEGGKGGGEKEKRRDTHRQTN